MAIKVVKKIKTDGGEYYEIQEAIGKVYNTRSGKYNTLEEAEKHIEEVS